MEGEKLILGARTSWRAAAAGGRWPGCCVTGGWRERRADAARPGRGSKRPSASALRACAWPPRCLGRRARAPQPTSVPLAWRHEDRAARGLAVTGGDWSSSPAAAAGGRPGYWHRGRSRKRHADKKQRTRTAHGRTLHAHPNRGGRQQQPSAAAGPIKLP